MKIVEKSSKIVKTFEVDYENGIKCEYTTTNGKLTKFNFSNEKSNLYYVENIEELKNTHWSNHHKLMNKVKMTISKIKKIDFDKLFYVGGVIDGMLIDRNGMFISTPIILDEIFSQCYLHIEKKKEKCQAILDSLNKEYIINSKVVEIPYYNKSEDKKHHYTIYLTVKLPDDLYNKFLKNSNANYMDDMVKVDIFNFLKEK